MANYDEIGEYALDQVLTKRLTTPGGSVAPTVAPELFPNLVLENDRPEWGYLKGERLCARRFTKLAVAAEFNAIQFYLPANAKEIAVIESIQARDANTFTVCRLVGIGGGLGGWVAQTVAVRDTRYNGERTSVIVEAVDNAVIPGSFPDLWTSYGAGSEMTGPLIISPGQAFAAISSAVNTILSFNITWRERGAQPGELV